MSELLLLNPRKRRGRKRRASSKRKTRTRRNPVAAYLNPRRKRRHTRRRTVRRHRSNPIQFRPTRRVATRKSPSRRHYRANPRMRLTMKGITDQVVEAGTGAVGATLVDILMGFVGPRLPATLATPTLYPVVKGGLAILFGATVGSMGGQLGRLGVAGARGSLICTLRDTLRMYLPADLMLGYINSGMVARNPRMRGMGAYVRGVNTPLMGVNTPLMGMGQSWSEEESKMYGPGYIAGGMRGVGAYIPARPR